MTRLVSATLFYRRGDKYQLLSGHIPGLAGRVKPGCEEWCLDSMCRRVGLRSSGSKDRVGIGNRKSQIGNVGVPGRKGDGGGMESQQTKPGLPDTHLGGVHHCIGNLAVGPVSGRTLCRRSLRTWKPGRTVTGTGTGTGTVTRCNHGPGSFRQGHDSRRDQAIESGPWRDDEVSGRTIDEGRECGLPFADDSDPGRCVIAAGVRRRSQFLEDPSIHSRHTAYVVVCALARCGPGDGESIEAFQRLKRIEGLPTLDSGISGQ